MDETKLHPMRNSSICPLEALRVVLVTMPQEFQSDFMSQTMYCVVKHEHPARSIDYQTEEKEKQSQIQNYSPIDTLTPRLLNTSNEPSQIWQSKPSSI